MKLANVFHLKPATISCLALMVAIMAPAAQAASVMISPNSANVTAGNSIELTVSGSDFSNHSDGGAFTVTWDPTVLTLTDIVIADPPWDVTFFDDSSAASGTIDSIFVATSVFGGVGPDFEIVKLNFDAVGLPGTHSAVSIADMMGGWVAPGAIGVDVDYVDASVNVVPLPAGIYLFATCLLGLAGIKRGAKNKLRKQRIAQRLVGC